MATASKIANEIKQVMESAGWRVFNFASHKRVARGSVAFTDNVYIRGGVSIYAEIKAGRDVLSEKQLDLLQFMRNGNTGPGLIYVLATCSDEVTQYVNYRSDTGWPDGAGSFFISPNYRHKT